MLSKSSQTRGRALTLHETKQWRCRGAFSQDFCCLNANAELTQWLTSVPFSRFLRRALGALLLFPRQANPGSLGQRPRHKSTLGWPTPWPDQTQSQAQLLVLSGQPAFWPAARSAGASENEVLISRPNFWHREPKINTTPTSSICSCCCRIVAPRRRVQCPRNPLCVVGLQ